MKQVLFFASVFILAIVTGCGTKPGEAQADGATTNNPTINVDALSKGTTTTPQLVTTSSNATVPITAPTVTTTSQPVVASNTAGLNPAHGQPGHRCDVAVGAPLSSAPATTAGTTQSSQKQVVTTTSSPVIASAPTVTAPGMNPAHGQPGHRCDIAVGAPLNSKPTTTPTVPANNTQESLKSSIATSTPAVGPGLNPAHGQPGHRCEIAVGAPLNSEPAPLKAIPTTTEENKTEQKKNN